MSEAKIKVIPDEILEDQELPAGLTYQEVIGAPESLQELDPSAETRLGDAETAVASVEDGLADLSIQGWQFDAVFAAVNYRSIAWTSGTLVFKDGVTFSIGSSGTGNMATTTYIYFDRAVSETALQITTTASTAVGQNKVLIAVATPNLADTSSSAPFQVFGGRGGVMITKDSIAANTITANEIAANTITANKMSISTLSAISADIGTITAGTITGITITGGTIQTATSGHRVKLNGSNTRVEFLYDSTVSSYMADLGVPASDIAASEWKLTGSGGIGSGTGIDIYGTSTEKIVGLLGLGDGVYLYVDSATDWAFLPTTDDLVDLGYGGARFRNLNLSGGINVVGNIDSDGSVYADDDVAAQGIVYAGTQFQIGSGAYIYRLSNFTKMPWIYHGYVSGTTLSKENKTFTISNPATGRYTITHNLGHTNYVVTATALRATGSGAYSAKVNDLSLNSCEVTIFDDAGSAVASDFMYTIYEIM